MKLRVPLYDFQTVGVEFALRRRYSLNGDRMGLGKTAQALSFACEVQAKKTLILCPSFLRLNWLAEVEKFLGAEYVDRFAVVSYDSVYHLASFEPFDLIVCDEVHYLKNMQAKRTQAVHSRMGAHPPKHFLGLSGTPVLNNVGEFYSLLRLTWLGGRYPAFDRYSTSQWLFQKEFMKETRLKIGGRKITKWEGLKNPEGLRDLIKPIYIRRKTEEVLSLPEQVRQEVTLSDESMNDAALEAAWNSYQGGKDTKNFSSAKAVNALAKVPATVELVKGMLECDEGPVLIFSDHVQATKALYSAFPRGHCITGETSMGERNAVVGMLNSGKIDTLVATIGSMSVGVNLTGCNRMVINDICWTPGSLDQMEARIHRIGQKKTCFYHYVLASKMDQYIFRTVAAKRKIIAEVGT